MYRTTLLLVATIVLVGVIWRLGTPSASGGTADALATAEVRIQSLERQLTALNKNVVRIHIPMSDDLESFRNDIILYCNILDAPHDVPFVNIGERDYLLNCFDS